MLGCVADYGSEAFWPQSSVLSHDCHDRNNPDRCYIQSNAIHDAPNLIPAVDRSDRSPNLAPSLAEADSFQRFALERTTGRSASRSLDTRDAERPEWHSNAELWNESRNQEPAT